MAKYMFYYQNVNEQTINTNDFYKDKTTNVGTFFKGKITQYFIYVSLGFISILYITIFFKIIYTLF